MLRSWEKAWWGVVVGALTAVLFWRPPAGAVPLDKDGDIKLGVRTYVNARIGTERTHDGARDPEDPGVSTSATWPRSAAGHLRQNRFFAEVELKHDLDRLRLNGVGPLSLLNDLPFKIRDLSYGLTYRGEGDGIYDWGPKEFSTAREFKRLAQADPPNPFIGPPLFPNGFQQTPYDIYRIRHNLRKKGVHRSRLFQAYLDMKVGDFFFRFGRQLLSWGETDAFRLLDNINPLDASFGGFLVPLDERRVPLDMLRAQYYWGDLGPLSEIFFEGYIAIDNKVGFIPGVPNGSPWALPSQGAPTNDTLSIKIQPSRTFSDARGGGRVVFNLFDATFSLAHYYTYFDTPAVQVFTTQQLDAQDRVLPFIFGINDKLPCPTPGDPTRPDYSNMNCGSPIHAVQTAPRVQVSGITTTFALPQYYSVIRSELAYFKDEPSFQEEDLNPFEFNLGQFTTARRTAAGRRNHGRRLLRDSINFVLGIDRNQWIRWLNPHQTFFISTQFFYKHIKNAAPDGPLYCNQELVDRGICKSVAVRAVDNQTGQVREYPAPNPNRQVLPIYLDAIDFNYNGSVFPKLEPVFISQPADSFLHTLFIGTSYRSGMVNPSFTFFYDWGGAIVYQPALTIVYDPFRFAIDYSILDAHMYKGGSGVSLLKDRDNVQFRFEYVI